MKKRLFLSITVFFILLISFVACGNNDENQESKTTNNPSQEVLSNLKYEYVITKDGKLAVKVTNNNDVDVQGIGVNITYYEENGNLLSSDTQSVLFIKSKSDYIIESYLPHDNEFNIIYPGKVEINLTNFNSFKGTIQNDKLGIKHNKSITGNVVLECINNFEEEVDVQLNIVYYKSNNIVACDSTMYSLQSKEVKSEEFYKPIDEEDNEIEFDTYKLYYNVIAIDEELTSLEDDDNATAQ